MTYPSPVSKTSYRPGPSSTPTAALDVKIATAFAGQRAELFRSLGSVGFQGNTVTSPEAQDILRRRGDTTSLRLDYQIHTLEQGLENGVNAYVNKRSGTVMVEVWSMAGTEIFQSKVPLARLPEPTDAQALKGALEQRWSSLPVLSADEVQLNRELVRLTAALERNKVPLDFAKVTVAGHIAGDYLVEAYVSATNQVFVRRSDVRNRVEWSITTVDALRAQP